MIIIRNNSKFTFHSKGEGQRHSRQNVCSHRSAFPPKVRSTVTTLPSIEKKSGLLGIQYLEGLVHSTTALQFSNYGRITVLSLGYFNQYLKRKVLLAYAGTSKRHDNFPKSASYCAPLFSSNSTVISDCRETGI